MMLMPAITRMMYEFASSRVPSFPGVEARPAQPMLQEEFGLTERTRSTAEAASDRDRNLGRSSRPGRRGGNSGSLEIESGP